MRGDRFVVAQLRKNLLRQLLAEFDPPLVEAVDVPDRALGEDFVLVQRDELAQRARVNDVDEDAVGGTVPGEGLGVDQGL